MSEPKQADHPVRLWLGFRNRHKDLSRELAELQKQMDDIRGNKEIDKYVNENGNPSHFNVDGTIVTVTRDAKGIQLNVSANKTVVI